MLFRFTLFLYFREMSEENTTTTTNNNRESESRTQDTLKASLEGCMAALERSKDTLAKASQQADEWLEAANSRVQEAAEPIRKSFGAVGDAFEKKENEVLERLEEHTTDFEETQRHINDANELADEISAILEDGEALLSGWDGRKPEEEEETVARVLAAGEKASGSEDIAKQLGALGQCEVRVGTETFLRCMERRLKEISEAKEVRVKRVLRAAPAGLAVERVCSVFAVLRWDKSDGITEYAVQKREEGREWGDAEEEGGLHCVDSAKEGSRCTVYPLKPDTAYEFRVRGTGANGVETRWSCAVSARTERKVAAAAAVGVYGAVHDLRENVNDGAMCATLFGNIITLSERDGKQNSPFSETHT